ncbi:ACP S-malonyltransferase [Peribacillus psychrosaccharolyticus]|uniref:Malonyl CoA-acyl carrier protein transacylase n=1 Tax=Peribacillus psychrosaccharolyticus TaxID=1407 RepID=A0A974NPD6_PERPY|nr:ACP S-malonyltransferase [Peribacillus psychrosaccharolyticus]MEC2053752.1 ACP S-malonyltransferase [Peribacillus psychrosaccharolyticus]MED3742633.1 ACP S-malonyltransferase [Peribacillus psychrosaccharolyticus]QQT01579.1 ACP S-malonyltransferase [Peribacillus psychrosaccharolyticus]
MGKIAFVFPGQGSQTVGMGKDFYESDQTVQSIFQEADSTLGFSLTDLILNGPQEDLTLTANTQPALLTVSFALYQAVLKAGITPDYTAGHSLGEYSALTASGAMTFKEAVHTVRKRGEYMEEAVPNGIGTMSAVLGMDQAQLEELTADITREGNTVQLANINCPGQIVISGTTEGVQLAAVKAKENGAKRAIPLNVSGPFHSILMEPAAAKLAETLSSIEVKQAITPVISNVTAQPVTQPEEIKEKLIEQLISPVRWEESIRTLLDLGVDTFIEIGPGKVLSGLIKKIDRSVSIYSVNDKVSLENTVHALRGN